MFLNDSSDTVNTEPVVNAVTELFKKETRKLKYSVNK